MNKKKLLYTSLTTLALASAIGHYPAYAEDETSTDLEVTQQSDAQDEVEDVIIDADENGEGGEYPIVTDDIKDEDKEDKEETFTASYTYLAIYYDVTNDKELARDGYRVDIVKDANNPQIELSKTYYDLDGKEISESDAIDYTTPIDIEGYEFVDKNGDGNGSITGGTTSITHNYKEVEKKEEVKLSTEVFGTKVNEDILPLKLSVGKNWTGNMWVSSVIDNLPDSDIKINLIVVDKNGKEMTIGRDDQSSLKTSFSSISIKNYPDGEYTLIVAGYTGYKANYQRYEGRVSFEIKNGDFVKQLEEPINKDVIAGVSQFPLKIEDVIHENTELINVHIAREWNEYVRISGFISWKPQNINYKYEIYNSEQQLMDYDSDSSSNSLELRNLSGIYLDNYPDGIYTIKMTGQADEKDDNQEFLGYSAFEIRKGRYVGIIPVLVTPKKEDDGKEEPKIPKLDNIPDKNLPKDNPDVDIIPEPDGDEIKKDQGNQDGDSAKDDTTPSSSDTTKSSSNTKQSASSKGMNQSSTGKSNTGNKSATSSSQNSNSGKTSPELGDDSNDNQSKGDTETTPKKEVTTKKKIGLPSTGEVASLLGVVGFALIGAALYFFKKRDK